MPDPYITVNQYTDSVTGHVNVSFYNSSGSLVATYGANVGDMDFNPFNGLEGGVYNETNPGRVPAHQSSLYFSEAQWTNALNYAQSREMDPGEFYFLAGENCVDFARDVIMQAGNSGNISNYLMPGTAVYNYAHMSEDITFNYPGWYDSLMQNEGIADFVRSNFELFWEAADVLELIGKVIDDINALEEALEQNTYYSPIVIDLDGDHFDTTSLSSSRVSFDLDADGVKERTAWVGPGDGFVAFDANRNGVIDNGGELFGGAARGEGFAELARFDTNRDGMVDASDPRFWQLQIWVDGNSNGETDPGELAALAQLGITGLSVEYYSWEMIDHGSLIGEHAYAVRGDEMLRMSDIYFKTDIVSL